METAGEYKEEPEYFCNFIGYPKSGHSLVGSLLDAHPNIIIAHELNVWKCLQMGFDRQTISSLIIKNSQFYAQQNRSWSGYSYLVPKQWNGKWRTLKVIGDKKGGGTSLMLHRHPQLLDKLFNTFPIKHKFIHVTRNPFDSITTLALRVKKDIQAIMPQFFQSWRTVARLKQEISATDWFDLRHETFITEPSQWLERLCEFLGQEAAGDYLDSSAAMVNPLAHQSRFNVTWPTQDIIAVENEMKPYPFLDNYSYQR